MPPSPPPLRRGDVRVRGGLAAYNTSIEVWDGAGWLRVRGVTGVSWSLKGPDVLAELELAICSATVDLLTPNERLGLDIAISPTRGSANE